MKWKSEPLQALRERARQQFPGSGWRTPGVFAPSDIRGEGGQGKSKHVQQKGRDKRDGQASLSFADKQLLYLLLSTHRLPFHLAHI